MFFDKPSGLKHTFLNSSSHSYQTTEPTPSSTSHFQAHRLPLLLELLQVLGQIDADAHHHVLGNQLPLPRIVIHLIQDVQKRLVAGQPTI